MNDLINLIQATVGFLHRSGITSLIDFIADCGFILTVPFAIYFFMKGGVK